MDLAWKLFIYVRNARRPGKIYFCSLGHAFLGRRQRGSFGDLNSVLTLLIIDMILFLFTSVLPKDFRGKWGCFGDSDNAKFCRQGQMICPLITRSCDVITFLATDLMEGPHVQSKVDFFFLGKVILIGRQ